VNHFLVTAERLFDGSTSPRLPRPAVRVAGGRIDAVADLGELSRDPAYERLDFPGCTILPGLIDTHVHLVFAALPTNPEVVEQVTRETDDELVERALANAAAALRAGVTTVRDCGGKNLTMFRVRERLARGEVAGADVLVCGMPITTTLGHCHWLGLIADGRDDALRAAGRMLEEGADFLKVMATGGNMTPTSDPMRAQYDDETLCGIADLGRSAGRHTAAHVLSQAALPGAVAARVRTIEHCDWRVAEDRYQFNPGLARRMIEQRQYAGLTMAGIARRAFLPEVLDGSGPVRRLDARFAAEWEMIAFGVPFTLHSDAGVRSTPVGRFALGLRAAVLELRLTPAEAIRAATATAAEAIGLGDRGVLAAGKRADLLVVEGDPLADVAALERVRAVFQAGRRVPLPRNAEEFRQD
jgi:imidazolonepropionase-like amidohydrolase